MMDFSQGAGQESQGGGGLIPAGQLAWAILTVRALKATQSGGEAIDVELTIDDGQPYARKKLWEYIGNPFHAGNSDAYKQMSLIAITRICEAARGAGPSNPAGYQLTAFEQLSGLRVAIKIKIEKGTAGYEDKNKVGEWLTPNPASQSGFKDYEHLIKGIYNKAVAAPLTPAAASGFGQAPTLTKVARCPDPAGFPSHPCCAPQHLPPDRPVLQHPPSRRAPGRAYPAWPAAHRRSCR